MIGLLLLLSGFAMAGPVDPLSPRANTCGSDNCLRAVRASAFPTRMGTQDCFSYFMTTITPATLTVTSTISFSITSVITNDITLTSVVPVTSTTVTDTTITDAITVTNTPGAPVGKRQVTIIPGLIPLYASACSGSVRYSSACSCIGATATTITAPAPIATTTISKTATPTTLTVLTTVETDFSTITVATLLTTTTDVVTTTSTSIAHVPVPVGYSFNCPSRNFATCCGTVSSDFTTGQQCLISDSGSSGGPYTCSADRPFAICCLTIDRGNILPNGEYGGERCTEAFT